MIEPEKLKDQRGKGTAQNCEANAAHWRPSSSGLSARGRGREDSSVRLGSSAAVGIFFRVIVLSLHLPSTLPSEERMNCQQFQEWLAGLGERRDHLQSSPPGG